MRVRQSRCQVLCLMVPLADCYNCRNHETQWDCGRAQRRSKLLKKQITDWFYLDEGRFAILSRLNGALGLLNAWVIFDLVQNTAKPYLVPAFRIGTTFIHPPELGPFINIGLAVLAIASCVALCAGLKQRIFPLLAAAILLYFGSRDILFFKPHFIVLNLCFFIASSFFHAGKSCTRRLIQLAVFSCYFYSAAHKLFYPDFMSGAVLESYATDPSYLRPFTISLLQGCNLLTFQIMSWATVALEFFLAFALFSGKLRMFAIMLGSIFHAGIAVFMGWNLWIFSLTMLIGYVAFLPGTSTVEVKEESTLEPEKSVSGLEFAASLAFAVFMLLVPLRFYTLDHLDLRGVADRAPWSFALFLCHEKTTNLDIFIQSSAGTWTKVEATDRMRWITSDSDLIALAKYMMQQHNTLRVQISFVDEINSRKRVLKYIDWIQGQKPTLKISAGS